MARTVIRSFTAQDAKVGTALDLQPGDSVENYRIERCRPAAAGDGGYAMVFESRGRRLRCPLVLFQARTEAAVHDVFEETPAREVAIAPR